MLFLYPVNPVILSIEVILGSFRVHSEMFVETAVIS